MKNYGPPGCRQGRVITGAAGAMVRRVVRKTVAVCTVVAAVPSVVLVVEVKAAAIEANVSPVSEIFGTIFTT